MKQYVSISGYWLKFSNVDTLCKRLQNVAVAVADIYILTSPFSREDPLYGQAKSLSKRNLISSVWLEIQN